MITGNRSRPAAKRILSLLLVAVGASLFLVNVDREYINLTPTAGLPHSLPLQSDTLYTQTFPATRANLKCLGFYLRPSGNLPNDVVTITVTQNKRVLGQGEIATPFIDAEGASRACFTPALTTPRGEQITATITIPPSLSNNLRLQLRETDGSFNPETVSFAVNEEVQPNPAGYFASYEYRPALAIQLGGLLLLAAIVLLVPTRARIPIYILGASLLFIAPALSLGRFPAANWLWALIAMSGTYIFLRRLPLNVWSSLIGAHVFAFTSWFPLQATAGRERYLIFALLPALAIILWQRPALRSSHRAAALIGVVALATGIIFLTPWQPIESIPSAVASPRDIFFDPNQIPDSAKTSDRPSGWDNFGSYIGLAPGALAIIGIVTSSRQRRPIIILGIISALIALTPLTLVLAQTGPLPPQHFVIVTTLALSVLAATGMERLQIYLRPYAITPAIVFLIVFLVLLDLWQIAATTMESQILPYVS